MGEYSVSGGLPLRRASLFLILACLALSFVHPVRADEGSEAYAACARGDFLAVLRILGPLAEQGNTEAQFSLGSLYGSCKDMPQDPVRTYFWLYLAASQGHERSLVTLKHIKLFFPRLTAGQVVEAKRLAQEWRPRQP